MFIHINHITLYYEQSGSGSPLLLLHGNGEDHHIFDKISAELRRDFTVYAIDSRNHGQSEKTGDYSYEKMSDDIYRFINALNLGTVYLAGFSDGAIVGLMLAMKHGEVIRKMALLGLNLKPSDFTEESYAFIKKTYDETGDPLFKMMLEQPDIELEDVRNIKIPTLLIAAEHDIYKPETFDNLLKTLSSGTLKIMQGHDHGSYIIGQDLLYPDLKAFFKEI